MRSNLGKILMMLSILVACMSTLGATAAQQTSTLDATPADEPVFPKFGIVPVGDHPDGFIKDLLVEPGETLELSVVVENFGDIPVTLRTYKVNALSAVNGGFLPGEEDDQPLGAASWIDYPTVELSLSPGEQQEIAFSVSVPADAEPGQYIAGLMAQTAESIDIPGSEILDQILNYVMSISFIVPGESIYSFELAEPQVVDGFLVLPITNTGTYLVRPAGELELTNEENQPVLEAPIQMGAVYAGDTTSISLLIPEQMNPGDYRFDVMLLDEESGATDSIENVTVTVPEPVDPTGVFVTNAAIVPNSDEVVFANVDVTLNNGGQQLSAANVSLEVMRDGEAYESFPLATNQVLLNGENQFTTRYIPADMWQSGEYTFSIKVSAVDPNGGQETILLDEELDATIEVP